MKEHLSLEAQVCTLAHPVSQDIPKFAVYQVSLLDPRIRRSSVFCQALSDPLICPSKYARHGEPLRYRLYQLWHRSFLPVLNMSMPAICANIMVAETVVPPKARLAIHTAMSRRDTLVAVGPA